MRCDLREFVGVGRLRVGWLLLGLWIASPCFGEVDWWGQSGYRLAVTLQIEGVISQVHIRNPHSMIYLDVTDREGRVTHRAVQWRGVAELAELGVNSHTLKVGEHVVVEGHPARNPYDSRVLLSRIVRTSDGMTWGDHAWRE